MSDKKVLKAAQVQLMVKSRPEEVPDQLREMAGKAAREGAGLVCLPEMFSCPYDSALFPVRAEEEGSGMWQVCSDTAKELGIYLQAGTVPEKDSENGRIYNTAYMFGPDGKQLAKHRKMHLYDISFKGKKGFRESDTLTPGNEVTVFDTEYGKWGICVCYDSRFPELLRLMTLQGAQLIMVPAAFNLITGPLHWDLTMRAQAMFNQTWLLATSTARDMEASYHAWGYSLAADPWGKIAGQLEEKEGILYTDIDFNMVDDVRSQLPLLQHRRTDVYDLSLK